MLPKASTAALGFSAHEGWQSGRQTRRCIKRWESQKTTLSLADGFRENLQVDDNTAKLLFSKQGKKRSTEERNVKKKKKTPGTLKGKLGEVSRFSVSARNNTSKCAASEKAAKHSGKT